MKNCKECKLTTGKEFKTIIKGVTYAKKQNNS